MVVVAMICEGSIACVLPTITVKYFGHDRGHQVHSFMYAAFGSSSVSGGILVALVGYEIGFSGIIFICGILTLVCCVLTVTFDDTKHFDYKRAVPKEKWMAKDLREQ